MKKLVLLPALSGEKTADGRIGITGKFLSGLHEYAERWPGPVEVLMEPRAGASGNLDDEAVDPKTLPFGIDIIAYDDPALKHRLRDAAMVHGSLGVQQNALPGMCSELGVPFVSASEYTLKTRKQIVEANTGNPLLRARRKLWEHGQERANLAAVRACAGMQCNGTPTYEAYRRVNPNTLLYFDTRTPEAELIDEEALEGRLERVLAGEPLRLAFTGRLNAMKGADHLVPFAKALRSLGVPFHLDICGGGSHAEELQRSITRHDLGAHITMHGILDFDTELTPFVREQVDVFVCPHVQGDPSCTYMETFAHGVPIVGYDNEAFDGLVDLAPIGWRSPLGDPKALASMVAQVSNRRELIATSSRNALKLARSHTMEATFSRRLEHLLSLARN